MKLGTITVKPDGRIVVRDQAKTRKTVFAAGYVLVPSLDEDGDPCLVRLDPTNPAHLLELAKTQFRDDKATKPADAKADWMPPTLAADVKQDKDAQGAPVPGKFNITSA